MAQSWTADSRQQQRICSHYQKTGRCKFGSDCKYSHDVATNAQAAAFNDRQWSHRQVRTACAQAARMHRMRKPRY